MIHQSQRNTHLELQHWNLPPKYVETFEKTIDIHKEVQIKCNDFLKFILNSQYYNITYIFIRLKIKRTSRKTVSIEIQRN